MFRHSPQNRSGSTFITQGVDIGQSVDPTAIIVLESTADKVHTVRWIETIPIGTSYPDVVERLAEVNERCRLDGPTVAIVDYTGVGRPVFDLLRTRIAGGLIAVTISGGAAVNNPGPYEFTVPKRDLVGAIEVVLQTRRLIITRRLQGGPDLKAQLKAFQFEISTRGRDSYEASAGHHDDLVLSLGLALWHAEKGPRRKRRMTMGHPRGPDGRVIVPPPAVEEPIERPAIGPDPTAIVRMSRWIRDHDGHVLRRRDQPTEPTDPSEAADGQAPRSAENVIGTAVVSTAPDFMRSRNPNQGPPPSPETLAQVEQFDRLVDRPGRRRR